MVTLTIDYVHLDCKIALPQLVKTWKYSLDNQFINNSAKISRHFLSIYILDLEKISCNIQILLMGIINLHCSI